MPNGLWDLQRVSLAISAQRKWERHFQLGDLFLVFEWLTPGMPLISCENLRVEELIAPQFFVSGWPPSDLIVTEEGGAEIYWAKTHKTTNVMIDVRFSLCLTEHG